MDGKTLEHFRSLFFQVKKDQLIQDLKSEDKPLETKTTGDDVDLSQVERDQNLNLKLKSRQTFFIKKVDHALSKIEDGSFGECEECEDEISLSRLFARPTASLCISCKEDQERGEGHILYSKKSHTAGKNASFVEKHSNVVSFGDMQKQKELKDKIIRFNEGRT